MSRDLVAQPWVGLSDDDLYSIRLVLQKDGTGRGAYAFLDEPAICFEIPAWRYESGSKIDIAVKATGDRRLSIKSLSGKLDGVTMLLRLTGEDWISSLSLRREADLETRWMHLKEALAPIGGHAGS